MLLPTAWALPVMPMSMMEAFEDRWLSYWGLFAVNFFMGWAVSSEKMRDKVEIFEESFGCGVFS